MKQSLLSVQNLLVAYKDANTEKVAVNRISFDIHRGEILAIVGESGSGKSSTARAIINLLPEGARREVESIRFRKSEDSVVLSLTDSETIKHVRGSGIGMVFQNPSLAFNPVRRIGSQTEDILKSRPGSDFEKMKDTLPGIFEKCGIPNPELVLNAYPHELSGGQKQRVLIALATSFSPELLIADEPTTALDVSIQARIIDLLLARKQETGMSLLLISHDLSLVAGIADRVIVMRNGEIVESGTASDIFNNPQTLYTKALIACKPPLSKRFNKLPVLANFESGSVNQIQEESSVLRKERHQKMYSSKPVLELNNVSARYENQRFLFKRSQNSPVLNNISLMLHAGETLGIAGESGSGKTSLGKVICGLLPISSGTISLKTNALTSAEGEKTAHARIQMVFQDPFSSFNPAHSILEAMQETLKSQQLYSGERERLKAIHAILEKVHMPLNVLRRFPKEFSGGQIQRLAIARALLTKPSCVVFDECVSSLDVSVQAGVLNLINELKANLNFSCLFISHDLSVVRYMSDRVMILKNGTVLEEGEADSLFDLPKHEYTQMLVNAIPEIAFKNRSK